MSVSAFILTSKNMRNHLVFFCGFFTVNTKWCKNCFFSVKCVQPQNSASTRCQCFFYQPLNVFEHLWVLDGRRDLCGKTQSTFEAALFHILTPVTPAATQSWTSITWLSLNINFNPNRTLLISIIRIALHLLLKCGKTCWLKDHTSVTYYSFMCETLCLFTFCPYWMNFTESTWKCDNVS